VPAGSGEFVEIVKGGGLMVNWNDFCALVWQPVGDTQMNEKVPAVVGPRRWNRLS